MEIGVNHVIFFATLGFSLAAPLGPVNMEMIKVGTSRKFGWIYGLVTGLGASTADFLIATIVLFIGAEFFSGLLSVRVILVILLFLNAGILGYIGWGALRSKVVVDNSESRGGSILKQFSFGFVLVVTSPWSYLWWVSFGPTIISTELPLGSFLDRAIVTMLFIFGIWLWVILLNGLLLISEKMASEKTLRMITVSSASLILVFAGSIALDAIWISLTGNPLQILQKIIEKVVSLF